MGEIATVERFERDGAKADVVVDTGGVNNRTAGHFEGPGCDGQPLPGDAVALQPGAGTGEKQALGYHDPVEGNRVAAGGEQGIYSRNPTTGVAVARVIPRNDGSIEIQSLNGAPIEIKSTGRVTVNSPDVRLGAGGRQVACVGDMAGGNLKACVMIGTVPTPVIPLPPTLPPGFEVVAVPIIASIMSGVSGVEAGTGSGE